MLKNGGFGAYISDKLNPFRRDIALNLSDFLDKQSKNTTQ
jgi:hypothetical protein